MNVANNKPVTVPMSLYVKFWQARIVFGFIWTIIQFFTLPR